MPIINLVMHRTHTLLKNAGNYSAYPALEAAGRLYAIHNPSTSRPVYVGTAGNVQNRFAPRITAARDWGLNNATLNPITIYVFRVVIDTHSRPPDNLGWAGGYDVEHLLIRLHIGLGINMRNNHKAGAYSNTSGLLINLNLLAAPGHVVPAYLGGAVINVAIPNNTNY